MAPEEHRRSRRKAAIYGSLSKHGLGESSTAHEETVQLVYDFFGKERGESLQAADFLRAFEGIDAVGGNKCNRQRKGSTGLRRWKQDVKQLFGNRHQMSSSSLVKLLQEAKGRLEEYPLKMAFNMVSESEDDGLKARSTFSKGVIEYLTAKEMSHKVDSAAFQESCKALYEELDLNQNGRIDLDDFIKLPRLLKQTCSKEIGATQVLGTQLKDD